MNRHHDFCQFCQDDHNWYKEAFTDFPYPVAHEYKRLYTMFVDGEVYGCIFQLKDVYEVILKHIVLCLSALAAKNEDEIYKEFVHPGKLLSLGDWVERIISSLAKRDVIKINKVWHTLLKNIKRCFGENGIVHWRNETLGHGALALGNDPEVVGDLAGKVRLLSDFLRKNSAAIQSLTLYQENVALKGHICPIGDKKLSFFSEGVRVPAEPFIIAASKSILYFDACRREENVYLDYIHGKKIRINDPVWLQKQKKFYSKVPVQSKSGVERETYLANIDDEINALHYRHDYLQADYIGDWIKNCLDQHLKGVFLLCAERGTGKSAFAYAADELSGGAVKFPGCTVRSYFMHRTLLRSAQDFIAQISFIFSLVKNADQKANIIRTTRPEGLPRLSYATETPKQDLAKLLKEYRSIHDDLFGKDKLLLFIDGIDETRGDDLKLLEFIPEKELLDEGIFIFFTCRIGDAFTPPLHVLNFIQHYPFTGSVAFDRHKENKALLEKYIEQKVRLGGRTLDGAQTERLIQALDCRFTNLPVLGELLKTGYIHNFDELVNGDFLDQYFSLLKLRYGDKIFNSVRDYLIVLGTLYEPLTIKEIVFLVRNSHIEVGDLSILSDLSCILVTVRSYRGNLYLVDHAANSHRITSCFKQELPAMVEGFLERIRCFKGDVALPPAEADVLLYIAAYLSSYVMDYGIHLAEYQFAEIADKINHIACVLGRDNHQDYVVVRKTNAYGSIIDYYQKLMDKGGASIEQEANYLLALLNSLRGIILLKNDQLADTYIEVIHRRYDELAEAGKNHKDIKKVMLLLQANLIGYYGDRHAYDKAVKAYESGIALSQELGDDYVRGVCERNFCGIERFLDPGNAVKRAEKIVDGSKKTAGYELAAAYLQLGQAHWMNGQLDKARESFLQALEVITRSGRPSGIHETEICYMVLWRVGQVMNMAEEITLDDLNFALTSIISGLRLIDEGIFAGNLGLEQAKARLLTSLALLYSRRYAYHWNHHTGDVDMLKGDYHHALAAITTAEAIWTSLDDMEVEYDISSAITTYLNHGYILSTFQRFPEGLDKVNEAIKKFHPKNPDEEKAVRWLLTARNNIQKDYDAWEKGLV